MQGNRKRDTRPEVALRRALHQRGLRYRVCVRPILDLAVSADVVFRTERVAVFLDGCFWHRCPIHHKPPSTNAAYWGSKIAGNVARDERTRQLLAAAGWLALRVWEHETPDEAAERVIEALRARRRPCRASSDLGLDGG